MSCQRAGNMRVVGFLTHPQTIKRILDHLLLGEHGHLEGLEAETIGCIALPAVVLPGAMFRS